MAEYDARPRFLNLLKIRLPVTGVVSILHRVSGFLLFLSVPMVLYLFQRSVSSEASFKAVMSLFDNGLVQIIYLLIMASLIHHLLAGIRYLFLDFDIGVSRSGSRIGAWTVFALEAVLIVAVAGVFL